MATLTQELPQLAIELLSCVINWPLPDGSHTHWHQSSNTFQGPVATDLTPPGSICDWCGHAGEHRLTAIGGSWHNKSGVFCNSCGQLFLQKIVTTQVPTMPFNEAETCRDSGLPLFTIPYNTVQ